MNQMEKRPYVPTEIHVATIRRALQARNPNNPETEGRLDIALGRQAADAVVNTIDAIRSMLSANEPNGERA
ncbi:hypothetical protein DBIPINDM_001395 [Mesorhizobium sp. AR02]|nr:hypothetical protein DBIPINDM_001395 [Mesorhizobium sp. AR02]